MLTISQLTSQPMFLLGIGVIVFGLVQAWWRYNQARSTAEEWLREHHYRVRELGVSWFHGMIFPPTLFRNSNRAFVFKAIIDDSDLGGTGSLWLRVWTKLLSVSSEEVEVVWDHMPEGGTGEARPLADRLADEQLALMRRIATGENRFYAPRRWERDGEKYDETVEHLLALSRRGMITCTEPQSGVKGVTRWSDVSNVTLTPAGRQFLESKPA